MKTKVFREFDLLGNERWFKEETKALHREDGPAFIWKEGSKYWYRDGELHREDGPAVENSSGTKEWWINGRRHRDDGPAIVSCDGRTEWYKKGFLHRENGPAYTRYDGSKEWALYGEILHKEEWWNSISDEMKLKVIFDGEMI